MEIQHWFPVKTSLPHMGRDASLALPGSIQGILNRRNCRFTFVDNIICNLSKIKRTKPLPGDRLTCFISMSKFNRFENTLLQRLLALQKNNNNKFSIKIFFNKCDQICRKLRIWSHLLKKSLIENILCSVFCLLSIDTLDFFCWYKRK